MSEKRGEPTQAATPPDGPEQDPSTPAVSDWGALATEAGEAAPADPSPSAPVDSLASQVIFATGAPPIVSSDERYETKAELGRGGMGRVLVAFDRRLGREVAIKEVLRSSEQRTITRFWRESLMTARLQHPGIVPVYEIGERKTGEPFLTMRRVEGRPLEQLIDDAKTPDARLRLLPNLLAAIDAVAYAHDRRVIHRDLKPANILVGQFGETVVIDWGLAKELAVETASMGQFDGSTSAESSNQSSADSAEKTGFTLRGAILGTATHMAPEQAAGGEVDARSDVYSLGVILYQLLTGTTPFTGANSRAVLLKLVTEDPPALEKLAPWAPRDLISIIKRAMSRKREGRFTSARGLGDELRGFLSGQLVGSHRYTVRQRLFRWTKKNAAAVSIAGIALLVLALIGAFSVRRILQERKAAEAARDVAEERQQELSLQRARLLMQSDSLAAVDAIEHLSPTRGGWADAHLLAGEIKDRGLPSWRLETDSARVEPSPDGLWIFDGIGRSWSLTPQGVLKKLPDSIRGEIRATSATAQIVVTEDEGSLHFYDTDSGREIGTPSKPRRAEGLYYGTTRYAWVRLFDGPIAVASIEDEGLVRIDPVADKEELIDVYTSKDWDASRDASVVVYSAPESEVPLDKTKAKQAPLVSYRWSIAKGKERIPGPARGGNALSPDAGMLAWIEDGRAQLESIAGTSLARSSIAQAKQVVFDSHGDHLAIVGDGGVELIDLKQSDASHRFIAIPNAFAVSFDESDAHLAVTSENAAWVVQTASGEIERSVHRSHLQHAWLRGGWLITSDDQLLGWPAKKPVEQARVEKDRLAYLAVSPAGRYLLTHGQYDSGGRFSSSGFWDAATRERHDIPSGNARFSPSGDAFAWSNGNTVHIQGLNPPVPDRTHTLREGFGWDLSSGRALLLLGNGETKGAIVVELDTGVESAVPLPAGINLVRPVGCGDRRFLSLSSDDKVLLIDARDGSFREIDRWPSTGRIQCSPDGDAFVLNDEGKPPMVGHPEQPGIVTRLTSEPSALLGLISKKGNYAFADAKGSLWLGSNDADAIKFDQGPLRNSSASPDGSRRCVVLLDNSLWLTAVSAHSARLLAPGKKSFVPNCGFSNDGKQIIAGSADGTVSFFDDDLPLGPALVATLRESMQTLQLPVDTTPDAIAQKEQAEAIRAVGTGQLKKAAALLDAALALHTSPMLEAQLRRNRGVVGAQAGDTESAYKYFVLYLPFARPDERASIETLIERYKPKPRPNEGTIPASDGGIQGVQ